MNEPTMPEFWRHNHRFLVFEYDYEEGYGWEAFKSAHATLEAAEAEQVRFGGQIVDLDTLVIVRAWSQLQREWVAQFTPRWRVVDEWSEAKSLDTSMPGKRSSLISGWTVTTTWTEEDA